MQPADRDFHQARGVNQRLNQLPHSLDFQNFRLPRLAPRKENCRPRLLWLGCPSPIPALGLFVLRFARGGPAASRESAAVSSARLSATAVHCATRHLRLREFPQIPRHAGPDIPIDGRDTAPPKVMRSGNRSALNPNLSFCRHLHPIVCRRA
jgi:hypothetical protein